MSITFYISQHSKATEESIETRAIARICCSAVYKFTFIIYFFIKI